MFFAHAPAGYIGARLLWPRLGLPDRLRRAFLWSGIVGSVAPDFDLAYFHWVDQRAHSHHGYVTHYPILWLSLLAAAWLWKRRAPIAPGPALALIFSLNGFIHMVLDSVVGGIRWLAPWSDHSYRLAVVPSLHHPWWLNFALHWSFLLELALVGWALYLASAHRPAGRAWRDRLVRCFGKNRARRQKTESHAGE